MLKRLSIVAALVLAGQSLPAQAQDKAAPENSTLGIGAFKPTAANLLFVTADGCALCHSASTKAAALWSATGDDVSPHGLWKGSLMAHAAKDPYWRAQVAKETARHPDKAEAIEALCVRCHAPTGHHTNRLSEKPPLRVAEVAADPLYSDGVTCTLCHQIQPDGLGTEARYDGNFDLKPGRKIFGPYPDPGGTPMLMHSSYTPTYGEHIRSAGLCGSCHTLRTEHTGGLFAEQTPYLEWRNSIFNDESGRTETSKSCRECHMPEVGPMHIARNPMGFDFNIATRAEVRGHSFVGGNAFMLDLLAANAEKLGVKTPKEALQRSANATRGQLAHKTATINIENVRRENADNDEQTLVFEVVVTNLTGHKFPTGYPSRRAWLDTQVRDGRDTLFESGEVDEQGRLKGIADELSVPHRDVIDSPSQVQIYEMVAADSAGKPTTYLSEMATRLKDTRLLPRGYSLTGPGGESTAPVGVSADSHFGPGQDRVIYRVSVPKASRGKRLTIVSRLLYQTIPPAWVAPLRTVDTKETSAFVSMYDSSNAQPERIAIDVEFSGN